MARSKYPLSGERLIKINLNISFAVLQLIKYGEMKRKVKSFYFFLSWKNDVERIKSF